MNKVIITGNITRDLELRYTPNGAAVLDIGIANNDDKESTVFIDVTLWKKSAELVSQFCHKGSKVLIEGSLSVDTWDDRETGKKRSKMKVTGFRVEFLDKKPERQQEQVQAPQQYQAPQMQSIPPQPQQVAQPAPPQNMPQQPVVQAGFDGMDQTAPY
jgi:single-strand DNA-binding protein